MEKRPLLYFCDKLSLKMYYLGTQRRELELPSLEVRGVKNSGNKWIERLERNIVFE
jgi:hypothetical protein